ncbi:MAG: hypothetical protein LBP72_03575 [Dysgonamonadaceae bacterium]|jgi:hypothetical protein|nr:hypothetical protein [Dysgonamonadaceae bacterium]
MTRIGRIGTDSIPVIPRLTRNPLNNVLRIIWGLRVKRAMTEYRSELTIINNNYMDWITEVKLGNASCDDFVTTPTSCTFTIPPLSPGASKENDTHFQQGNAAPGRKNA